MKRNLFYISIPIVLAGLAYLCGVIVSRDFNPLEFGYKKTIILVFLWYTLTIFCVVCAIAFNHSKNK